MKLLKFFYAFVLMLFLPVLMLPAALFSQTTDPVTQLDINSMFTSFLGFGAGVIILTGLISAHIVNLSTLGRSILSWVIAAGLGFLGWWLNLGIFSGVEWTQVLVIVISFATGSNVIYNIQWLRSLLATFKLASAKSEKK